MRSTTCRIAPLRRALSQWRSSIAAAWFLSALAVSLPPMPATAKPVPQSAAKVEAQADAAYAKGKFADAAQLFLRAAELAPERRDLILGAALAFERAEQFDEAVRYCQEFVSSPRAYADRVEKARVRLEFLQRARNQGGVPILFESAEGVHLFAQEVGAQSISEVLGWPVAKFGNLISKEKEQEDTRPHLQMYRARPQGGRQFTLWLYFHRGQLYRIGHDFPCTRNMVTAEVERSPGAYSSQLPGGNSLVEVKLGRLVERIILPVGEKPKCEWWLYDLKVDRDLGKKELAVFEAYGWNDAGVKALEPPADFAKADEYFGSALKANSSYAAAASRWCAAILDSGSRDAARARSVCAKALHSKHRVYVNRAKRALATIRTW